MIGAVSSEGRVFFTINQGKNTTVSHKFFMMKLIRKLEETSGNWRKRTVFLMDNASIHRSQEALDFYQALGLHVMFLAPYSFEMAAVEKLFAYVKNRDLNPLSVRKYSR